MIKAVIVDGTGTGQKLKINGEGELNAVIHPHPPRDEKEAPLPYRAYMTLDGAGVDKDMLVDGSTNSVEFCILAENDHDIYIKNLAIVIADAGASLNKFGNITALTNGIKFDWISQDLGNTEIHEGLKSNFDFIQMALGSPSIGTGRAHLGRRMSLGHQKHICP